MKKRSIIALVLALMMCVALVAACGETPPAGPTGPTDPTAGGTTNGTDASGEEVTEVHIGLLGPWTGGAAYFGVSVRNGALLYIENFNAQGGLQIRVTDRDEEGDSARAVTMYHDLVDAGVTAIIGSVTSGPTMAVVPEAFADGMPMISGTATHAGVTVNQDTGEVFTNMFRSCFIDPFQGVKMAEFAHEILSARTAAVLYAHDIDYSIGLMQAFVDRAAEIGLEVIHIETFADEAPDFTAQLTNIAAANPDVVFIPVYNRHTALIGPQSAAAGVTATMLGADGWAGTLDAIADPSTVEGAFYLTGFTYESEEQHIIDFIERFEAQYGIMPNMFAAQAYDAAAILIRAIEGAIAAGLTPGTDEFKQATIANMAATDIEGVTGRITFDRYNNPQKTAFILQIIDGEARFWGTF
ncbi:MAG: ABC transporter substrate-binding protein [Oscillospiraceae bacterium]|nr:ABC transporter substrate-binding protein [Oscillospiraceae bacterium]